MNLIFWFRKVWQRHGPKRHIIIVESDTPPDPIPSRHVYLCHDDGVNWSVAMRCPCGCGDSLELMLLKEIKPNWSLITIDQQPPSLKPSIWRRTGCQSHFWLRNGHIHWC